MIAGLHPGAIILMHENRGQTVRALLGIFAALARRRLRAVSVPQLLRDDPARPGDAALSRCRLRRARGRPDGQLTRDLVGLAHAYS